MYPLAHKLGNFRDAVFRRTVERPPLSSGTDGELKQVCGRKYNASPTVTSRSVMTPSKQWPTRNYARFRNLRMRTFRI